MPTCGAGEAIGVVRERVSAAGWDVCMVVNDERVVLGILRAAQLVNGEDERVETVMRPGPSTFRPYIPIEDIAHHMIHHDLASSPITTSDGRLVGLLTVDDAAVAAEKKLNQRTDEDER